MLGSAVVYSGLVVALLGAAAAFRPRRRRSGLAVAASGIALTAIGFLLPARESRVGRAASQLNRFAPVWQFHEVHRVDVAAPPEKVYEAIRRVRADEILLFRTLTWIEARRKFATYWRVIYPGSALIRRMWLRAIARRALRGSP